MLNHNVYLNVSNLKCLCFVCITLNVILSRMSVFFKPALKASRLGLFFKDNREIGYRFVFYKIIDSFRRPFPLQRLPLTRALEGFCSVCCKLSFCGRQSTVSMVFSRALPDKVPFSLKEGRRLTKIVSTDNSVFNYFLKMKDC